MQVKAWKWDFKDCDGIQKGSSLLAKRDQGIFERSEINTEVSVYC